MEREKRIIRTSIYGIIVNIVLVIFKSIIGFMSNSIAIILDAVNNLSDVLSATITIIGTKLSLKKPDLEHPYGHGRIEYISSFIIVIIVMLAGFTSLKESFIKIVNPVQAEYSVWTVLIIIVAIFVKFFFGKYVKSVGESLNSQSLIATGMDAFMDAVLSFSTFVAALFSIICHLNLEGYIGAFISIIIIKSSYDILIETLGNIIGARPDPELTKKIRNRIMDPKEVQGVFDLALHNYGPSNIIGTAHIQVRDNMTAKEIHILTRKIQTTIYEEFGIVMTLGIYAANDAEEYREIKNYIEQLVNENGQIKQMHGFYVDNEIKLITFDLIFDFKCRDPKKAKEEIESILNEKYPDYFFNVVIDMDLSD